MSQHPDCLVIGGGIIGMLTARELSLAGLSVTLLERGETGQESSWAGGGILSPLYPWRYANAVSDLAQYSQRIYPDLAEALGEESGIDVERTQSGLLMPDCEESAAAQQWAQQYSATIKFVQSDELADIAPELSPELIAGSAIWLPDVAQVRNPRFAAALRGSIESLGVKVLTGTTVNEISLRAGKVEGVVTDAAQTLVSSQVVLAGGAWSAGLLEGLGLDLPVEPVRGQMLLYKTEPGTVKRIILNRDRYVIPRRDGRVLIGSTMEHAGFDKQITASARTELEAEACRLIPALENFEIEQHWAGLRPGSPDGVPFIGACPGVEGLFLNTGHYRNGIILGPASAALLASMIVGKEIELASTAYAPEQTLSGPLSVTG